jgi:regulator of protease activity HflC (stomatin/prohibitin superfamily)
MVWFTLTVIAALVAVGAFVATAGQPRKTLGRIVAISALGVWLVLTLFFFTFTTIEAGHVGLVKTFGNYTATMTPGWNSKFPWQTVDDADVRVQSKHIVMDGGAGGSAVSAETQPVYATVTLNYSVDPAHVLDLYRNVGPRYYDSIIAPRVQQVFKSATVEYKTIEVAPNREKIRVDVQQILDRQLDQYGINVTDFLIENLDFAPEFVAAITDKQVATQQAEAARAKVEQAKQEAQQAIAKARGEAESIRVRGLALRRSPEVLQLEAIEKLNPNVQAIYLPAGGNFLMNMPSPPRAEEP